MPDTYTKLYRWDLCSRCSGDGISNSVPDENGNSTEGTCPKCAGFGYVKSSSYCELNLTELKAYID